MDHKQFQLQVRREYLTRVGQSQTGDLMLLATLDALGAAVQDAGQAQVIMHVLKQQAALEALQARLIECGCSHPALLLLADPARYADWVLAPSDECAPQICIAGCGLHLPQRVSE